YTAGKTLLLGRQTFEEMRGWFNGEHRPIVLSSERDLAAGDCAVVDSVSAAVKLANQWGEEELVVCGGAAAYGAALPHATGLVLTIVHRGFDAGEGGAYFPDWEGGGFVERQRDWWGAGEGNPFAMTILQLSRLREEPRS
ncbi:MAG: dihydrofolate reductase, partial [bacterium]|nr:dihydrofolate reductase [bacterium]